MRVDPIEFDLTKEEKRAIAALSRLEKIWPKTLWLFATGMSLHVMRCSDGGHVTTSFGGMDPNYIVDSVDIPNDGGDW